MTELRKFKSLVNETRLDDGGVASFVFTVTSLEKGKIYTQADQSRYDEPGRRSAPFFVDDNGCSRDIALMLHKGFVEEVQ